MLPEWIEPERAMHRLERVLHARGMTDEANDALTYHSRRQHHLPGFHVFTSGAEISPYEWCVPRPRYDQADVMNTYEAYVDRNLGLVPNPGLVAREAVGKGWGRKYFGLKRTPARWRVPLLKVVAVGQHAAKKTAFVGRDRVELQLDSGLLLVTSRGAHSNFRGHIVTAKKPAVDIGFSELSVEPIKTAHSLAAYLSGRVEDDVLWLANVVIQGERFGLIPAIQFRPPAARPTPRRRRALAVDVLGAALTCQELLRGEPREDLLHALFEAAVPTLMTSNYFRNHFGQPRGPRSQRLIRAATREEWSKKIEAIVEDLQAKH
jgi:hypothetical protein